MEPDRVALEVKKMSQAAWPFVKERPTSLAESPIRRLAQAL